MHKKIESELVSIAHSILQMKNKEDVLILQEKAKEVYEKLSVLAFVDRYIETTHGSGQTKEEILIKIEDISAVESTKEEVSLEEVVLVEDPKAKTAKKKSLENTVPSENEEAIVKNPEEVMEETKEEEIPDLFSTEKTDAKTTLEEELKDVVDIDVVVDLLEKTPRADTSKTSLNKALVPNNVQIGLNDRIAFVKHLFEGSQEDFNRVVSQINSFKYKKEAVKFISKIVKPDYDWKGKEEFEERFMSLIERKFTNS